MAKRWGLAVAFAGALLGGTTGAALAQTPIPTPQLPPVVEDLARRGVIALPSVGPGYVTNHDPLVHIWSGPTTMAVDFGPAAPQWTVFIVVGTQEGGRVFVYNPVTENVGWIDAAGVGPALPP